MYGSLGIAVMICGGMAAIKPPARASRKRGISGSVSGRRKKTPTGYLSREVSAPPNGTLGTPLRRIAGSVEKIAGIPEAKIEYEYCYWALAFHSRQPLIPDGAGRQTLSAGFGQIEAQVMKVGMVAEASCISKPWTIIPMVVTGVQDYIAAGQFRGGEQLVEAQQVLAPGTILTFLEPIYQGGLDGVTPGSSCIVNAYTSNHDRIAAKETGAFKGFVLHAVDAVGFVHAMLLRVQALMLPIKTLVLSGH
jgi:hypothetical protein